MSLQVNNTGIYACVCALRAFVLSDQSGIYHASPPRRINARVYVICVASYRDTVLDACCEAESCHPCLYFRVRHVA
jgi:hypothetical protein